MRHPKTAKVTCTGFVLALAAALVPGTAVAADPAPGVQDRSGKEYAPAATEPPAPRSSIEPNRELQDRLTKSRRDVVAVVGRLHDAEGNPVRFADVRLDLDPRRAMLAGASDGVAVQSLHVGTGSTNENGEYVIRAPSNGDWDGYIEADGTVAATISSLTAEHNALQRVTLLPPSRGKKEWRLPDVEDTFVVDGEAEVSALSTARAEGTVREPTQSGGHVFVELLAAPVTSSSNAPGEVTAQTVDGVDVCGSSFYYWSRSDANIIRDWSAIQRVHTDNQVRVTYNWSNGNSTDLTYFANVGTNRSLVSVGYGKTVTSASGVNFSIPAYTLANLELDWDWRAYNLYCGSGSSPTYSYSGTYEWRPYLFTGGNRATSTSTTFSCVDARTTTISSPLWVTRTAVVAFSGTVNLGSVSGASRQTNTTSHTQTFSPSSPTAICGNNDYPTQASIVRER